MVSLSALVLLTGGLVAQAKLSGWPDDFALSLDSSRYNNPRWLISDGWGNRCDKSKSVELDHFSLDLITHPGGWDWVNMRKPYSAWVDVWRAEGDTFNMYEQNGDGTIQGQCQVAEGDRCPWNGGPMLHCWQW